MPVINISAYKFVALQKVKTLQVLLKAKCEALGLLGTITLGAEGINLNLAGESSATDKFEQYLIDMPAFKDIAFKVSASEKPPFEKLVVRLKDEIVTIRDDRAQPLREKGHYLSAETFKQWLDEKRDMLVLDTRNDFEVAFGTFEAAQHLAIENFSEFPEKLKHLPDAVKDKPVVTFCTGGIRCEKAVLVMQEEGFKQVYQLAGGILKYFETCHDAHYKGECFVFDERISVDGQLEETGTTQCPQCFGPVSKSVESCPKCIGEHS